MFDPLDGRTIIACGHAILDRGFGIHQQHQDPVQHLIGRQAVLVLLVGAQFGAGGFFDDPGRDHLARRAHHPVAVVLVAPAAGGKDARLVHVLDRIVAARHVAIDRGIAHRHFGLVARGQQHVAELVAHRHQQQTAQAGLDVFLGQVGGAAFENRRQRVGHGGTRAADRHRVIGAAQRLGHGTGVLE